MVPLPILVVVYIVFVQFTSINALDWHVWYFIRPLTSTIAGAISYLFLKAGLLVLESSSNAGSSEMGFFALAFIAGFNVDKFVAKIEEVAKAVWGIEKTRSATNHEVKDLDKKE